VREQVGKVIFWLSCAAALIFILLPLSIVAYTELFTMPRHNWFQVSLSIFFGILIWLFGWVCRYALTRKSD
jgi:uncharacterized membrane protein YfhO